MFNRRVPYNEACLVFSPDSRNPPVRDAVPWERRLRVVRVRWRNRHSEARFVRTVGGRQDVVLGADTFAWEWFVVPRTAFGSRRVVVYRRNVG